MKELKSKRNINKALSEKIFAVVNPVSANGKTAKDWPEFAQYFNNKGVQLVPVKTEYPEHAVSIVRNALKDGYKNIMSVGGDGTANEVVNGFFDNGRLINPEAKLIVFSRGTGSDLIKSIGINNSKREIYNIINNGKKRMIDIGKISYRNNDGIKAQRYFLNISDAGIGGETVARVNNSSKFYGGILTYLFGALKTLAIYENKNFELIIDGEKILKRKINSIMVANGSYFAGGMKIAPEAVLDNGFFNVIILGDLSRAEIVKNLYKAYNGNHLNHPKIESYKGRSIKISSTDEVLLNIDGESAGKLPASFTILPQKLPVMVV